MLAGGRCARLPPLSMRRLAIQLTGAWFLILALSSVTAAQIPLLGETDSDSWERISETHYRFIGQVEIRQPDLSLVADVVDVFTDTNTLEASGSVVFVQGTQRISADRIEFNLATATGVFHNAFGTMTLGVLVAHGREHHRQLLAMELRQVGRQCVGAGRIVGRVE